MMDIVHGKVVSRGEEKLKDGTWILFCFGHGFFIL
jgi:hypothetical protein